MGKKKKKMTFAKMLKENQKDITVMHQDKKKTVAELTAETVKAITAAPLEGMIPVSSGEAAENTLPDIKQLSVSTSYAQNVFSMYEFALKYTGTKQTLVVSVQEDDIWDMLNPTYPGYGPLRERTNLSLVLDKFPDNYSKKVTTWANKENGKVPDMFIIRIPNLIIFHGNIQKKEPSKAKFFDLIIQVIRSEKSLPKLRKRNEAKFDETVAFYVEGTAKALKNLGVSCAHIPLESDFFKDPHDYARLWGEKLTEEKNKILMRVIFCTPDPDVLVSFNSEIGKTLSEKTGAVMV